MWITYPIKKHLCYNGARKFNLIFKDNNHECNTNVNSSYFNITYNGCVKTINPQQHVLHKHQKLRYHINNYYFTNYTIVCRPITMGWDVSTSQRPGITIISPQFYIQSQFHALLATFPYWISGLWLWLFLFFLLFKFVFSNKLQLILSIFSDVFELK